MGDPNYFVWLFAKSWEQMKAVFMSSYIIGENGEIEDSELFFFL